MGIRQQFEAMGITSDDLDDVVMDRAMAMVSVTNNGGMNDQLAYLVSTGMTDTEIIKSIVMSHCNVGDTITVSDPVTSIGSYSQAFAGVILEFLEDDVRVRDQDDNVFDIDYRDIEDWTLPSELNDRVSVSETPNHPAK